MSFEIRTRSRPKEPVDAAGLARARRPEARVGKCEGPTGSLLFRRERKTPTGAGHLNEDRGRAWRGVAGAGGRGIARVWAFGRALRVVPRCFRARARTIPWFIVTGGSEERAPGRRPYGGAGSAPKGGRRPSTPGPSTFECFEAITIIFPWGRPASQSSWAKNRPPEGDRTSDRPSLSRISGSIHRVARKAIVKTEACPIQNFSYATANALGRMGGRPDGILLGHRFGHQHRAGSDVGRDRGRAAVNFSAAFREQHGFSEQDASPDRRLGERFAARDPRGKMRSACTGRSRGRFPRWAAAHDSPGFRPP